MTTIFLTCVNRDVSALRWAFAHGLVDHVGALRIAGEHHGRLMAVRGDQPQFLGEVVGADPRRIVGTDRCRRGRGD